MSRRAQVLECEAMLLNIARRSYEKYLIEPALPTPPMKLVQAVKTAHCALIDGVKTFGIDEQTAENPHELLLELELAKENVRKEIELRAMQELKN